MDYVGVESKRTPLDIRNIELSKSTRNYQGKQNKELKDNEKEKNVKVVSWNVAGLTYKDRQFWKYIEETDIIGMVETWVDQKK